MYRSNIRYYAERENVFGLPRDQGYTIGLNGEPVMKPRDTRMWMSVEWAAERGIPVPDNWRELE